MPTMRIPMPLKGLDPASEREARLASEDRSFRMVSEGELFYVDTDLDEDVFGTNRHDHGHLGGVSLEQFTRFTASKKLGEAQPNPDSVTETESASRSSSQSSENSWNGTGETPAMNYAVPSTAGLECNSVEKLSLCSIPCFLREAQGVDFWKIDDLLDQRLDGLPDAQLQYNTEYHEPLRDHTPPSFQQPPPSPHNDEVGGDGFERALYCIFGGRVEDRRRNFSSHTSTKTFEVSSKIDMEHLTKLGVTLNKSGGLEAIKSVTFTTYIAGFRVIASRFESHAEYDVRVKGGGRTWSKWIRFSRFKELARYTAEDLSSGAAWNRVKRAMPHFRCLHPEYLGQKCRLLEVFLQQALFALASPIPLVHFVRES